MRQHLDSAVRFGESVDGGIGPNKAFPFFYNFIARDDDNWDANKGTLAGNLTGLGVSVPSGTTRQHAIILDYDYNFLLIHVKYTAYYLDVANSNYEWYNDEAGWRYDFGDYQLAIGTPLTNFVTLSASFQPNAQYLYGGSRSNPLTQTATVPIPIEVLQGYDYGMGQVRTPYLLPREGRIMLEVSNAHPSKDLVVGGAFYGMKVRV